MHATAKSALQEGRQLIYANDETPAHTKTLHTPSLGPRHIGHCSPMVAEHAPHRHLWPHGKMRCVGGSTQHTMQRWSPDASDAGTDSLIALGGTSSNGGGGYTTVSSSNATGSRTDQTAKQNLPRNKRGTPRMTRVLE